MYSLYILTNKACGDHQTNNWGYTNYPGGVGTRIIEIILVRRVQIPKI